MTMLKTRFAPSPTGNFHMGGLRTAIYNYLYAKKNNGTFLLRIEDTDQERSKKVFEEEILQTFKIFELNYDEINYQSKNIQKHKEIVDSLLDQNLAYKENDGPYRFKVNREKDYFEYEDLILGKIKIPSENIEDFSIARSDKSPTFVLSNLVDDHLDQITHVIRGNDHSINTIKQKLIAESLSFNKIKYAHIPLIHNLDGKKLSKRDNITNVDFYLNEGFLKESIFNQYKVFCVAQKFPPKTLELTKNADLFWMEINNRGKGQDPSVKRFIHVACFKAVSVYLHKIKFLAKLSLNENILITEEKLLNPNYFFRKLFKKGTTRMPFIKCSSGPRHSKTTSTAMRVTK